ncbi:unnamed protein product [Aphanomyces euteiches]
MATLGEDVASKIALFIADQSDLIAFLGALRPLKLLGPLEHLLQLSLDHPRANVWPKLDLSALDLTSLTTFVAVEATAKYYSCVSVTDFTDMQWLETHLNPEVKLEWSIDSDPSSVQYWNEWTSLHMTHLSITVKNFNYSHLVDALPLLNNLKSLCLSVPIGKVNWLDEVLAFAATSAHLESLELLTAQRQNITASMVQNTIAWFNRQPVRVFAMWNWNWVFVDKILTQTFFDTIFDYPMLDHLHIANTSLLDMDFSSVILSMRSLHLDNCLSSPQLRSLATQLESSTVQEVTIVVSREGCYHGLLYFLQHLHLCPSIQSLDLALHCNMSGAWESFLPLFERCQLKSLTLRDKSFDFDSLSLLGTVVRSNRCLCHVQFPGKMVDLEDIRNFLEMATIPNRPVDIKSIRIDGLDISPVDKRTLVQMVVPYGVQTYL